MDEQGHHIVLVRHGETEWSAAGRHTSRTDVPLTEGGRRQGEALGSCLKGWRFALVLTSPLRRATETCRLAGLGDDAEIRPDLVEWDYGEYEGRTTYEIRMERPGWTLWSDGVPGGESAEQVGARADRILAEAWRAQGDVALFSHGHFLRVLATRWIGLPPGEGRSLALDTATMSVLGFERETPVIVQWNQPC
ncbi:MAG TPA: histidine phosphatase family protein [Actinomycetota bacterium]|nr:histidine phosphatase family protein [Actinomycetota bacterium]